MPGRFQDRDRTRPFGMKCSLLARLGSYPIQINETPSRCGALLRSTHATSSPTALRASSACRSAITVFHRHLFVAGCEGGRRPRARNRRGRAPSGNMDKRERGETRAQGWHRRCQKQGFCADVTGKQDAADQRPDD